MENENKIELPGTNQAQTPAENEMEKAMTHRQKAMDRVRQRNAERTFADDDDEALYSAINEDYDADSEELGKLRGQRDKMNEFLRTDSRSADFFSKWHRDGSPIPALVKEYGKEIVSDITNPDIQAQIELDQQQYLKRMADSAELDAEADENLKKSREEYQELLNEGNYTQEQIDNALNSLEEKFANWLMNMVSKDMIVSEIKAMGYDADTEQARRNGRVSGRNENIEKEFERRRGRGDGVPALTSGGQTRQTEGKANSGALDRMSQRGSIWD